MSNVLANDSPTRGYSSFAGSDLRQIRFRVAWFTAMIRLFDHEFRVRKAKSHDGKECARKEYELDIKAFCEVERLYIGRRGFIIDWCMPPAIQDHLQAIHDLAALLNASPEEMLTDDWRQKRDGAYRMVHYEVNMSYQTKPEDLRFHSVIDHCRWLIAVGDGNRKIKMARHVN